MGDERDITLWDYGKLDNLDHVSLGFQPSNPVVFNIKNNVMMNLKSNQFSGKEPEDYNTQLTHFMDAYITINPTGGVSIREMNPVVWVFFNQKGKGLAGYTTK